MQPVELSKFWLFYEKFKTPTALTLGVSAWCRSNANHHFRKISAHYDDRWHFIVASLVLGLQRGLKTFSTLLIWIIASDPRFELDPFLTENAYVVQFPGAVYERKAERCPVLAHTCMNVAPVLHRPCHLPSYLI
jgi:hypothetical protein